jgi:hypothetical protein
MGEPSRTVQPWLRAWPIFQARRPGSAAGHGHGSSFGSSRVNDRADRLVLARMHARRSGLCCRFPLRERRTDVHDVAVRVGQPGLTHAHGQSSAAAPGGRLLFHILDVQIDVAGRASVEAVLPGRKGHRGDLERRGRATRPRRQGIRGRLRGEVPRPGPRRHGARAERHPHARNLVATEGAQIRGAVVSALSPYYFRSHPGRVVPMASTCARTAGG